MKEKIANYLKFAVFLWVTLIGFFTTYAIAWISTGLPTEWWASASLLALAVLSELGFITWLEN